MNHRLPLSRMAFLFLILAVPLMLGAQPIGVGRGGGESYSWDVLVSDYDEFTLTIATPDEDVWSTSFPNGKAVVFHLSDLPGEEIVDGDYTYQLSLVPRVSDEVRKRLAEARAAGDDRLARKIMIEAGIYKPPVQVGSFQVSRGSIVPTDQDPEKARFDGGGATTDGATSGPTGSTGLRGPVGRFEPAVEDFVIPDDLIVQGSTCIGLDCVDGEVFNFDTLRLKENNLRIHFDDTSTTSGFPANDWRIIANDSASGGASKFSIEDSTGAKTPFTIEAGSTTNSIFIDSTGRVGFRSSTPVLDLHVNTSNTPGIRLEQNNTGGFTAQTWDIAGNEANFFVRDVTSGSRLSFRIRPGAPTSSIDISADGDVGIGTGSPQVKLDVRAANAHVMAGNDTTDWMGPAQTGFGASNTVERMFFAVQTGLGFVGTVSNTDVGVVTNNSTKMVVTAGGNVGIGTLTPASDLVIANGGTTSSINAGSAQFTVASSRTFKDNIAAIDAPDILSKIESIPVVTYDYKDNGPKDRLGLIAEDFHTIFNRGSEKYIDGQEVQMALWLAVQKLTQENKALTERLTTLEKQLETQQQP